MSELIKVLDGGDFRDRWSGIYITLEDYENISSDNYEQELFNLFEYHGFEFDHKKHKYWEIE
ncbi:hypothetical protein HN258_04765 [Acinetobacter baumannii]|uniref:hypothetical protein n=1 Tax=Acinetobacter baumannii TaxID=470 RepID=UPI0018997D67|nr:hypothetical protein [Acinetobacter baumannii]MBF6687478.1 hypothetical protein [Acinetobacter baumannii]MBF6846154.1 hypothetical protein [Acinetobacter baumannii]MBF6916448.1 hypothetical protein [Acinetobacter baumannii]MBF6969321.1 hypothetical protein [Acinetobacter baumannii]